VVLLHQKLIQQVQAKYCGRNIYIGGPLEGENGTERTSNVAQVAIGCFLAYGIVFYSIQARGYANY